MADNDRTLKYAAGVAPAPESEADSEFFEALTKTGKRRITTMIDEDVYKALKQAAITFGDGHYQTFLNQQLRAILMGPLGLGNVPPTTDFGIIRMFEEMRKQICALTDRIDAIDNKSPKASKERASRRPASPKKKTKAASAR